MKFFSLENPIWKFIGNLADFFLLSCLWYLCCLPVVTAGAATTALYYVTLKMARGQEGQLIPAFFHSFKQNLKQATALWVGYLAVGILLVLDLVICLQTSSVFAGAMFFTSVVLLACWALFITMLFPLVARCDNTIGALFKMGIAVALRNVMPVLAALMVTVAFFAVGVFVYYPEQVEALCAMGIQYSRTVESTGSFALPQELLRWKPTCHHNDKLLERAEKFLHVPGYEKMPLFYIWGHSFEFERENTWPLMEQLAEKLHGAQDIWYATNGQIADYLTALRSTRESADGKRLYNPSAQPIWFVADGKVRVAEPGKLCEI